MRPIFIVLALAACAEQQATSEAASCEDTPTALALDEASPLGFSPQDVVDVALGTFMAPLAWEGGGTTELTLDVHSAGTARFVTSDAVYPDSGIEPAILCEDRVEVDATVSFTTADGAFDETWPVVLRSTDGAVASFHVEPDPEDLGGTYDVTQAIEEESWDDVKLWVDATIDAAGSHGTVTGQVSGTDPDCEGDDCTAWASQLDLAAWAP